MSLLKFNFLSVVLDQMVFYPTPQNMNYFWNFGSLAGLFLGFQMMTGLFLSMHYTASVLQAFASLEHMMSDVNGGWLIRYLHANGASIFFMALYAHAASALYYRSYVGNYYAWVIGLMIFLLSMATAFLGYVLPWGQMSFWGATVITNLFSAMPFVGKTVSYLLWGGFAVGNPTLNSFFSLHFLFPFLILAFVMLHILLLHESGSSAPMNWKYADKMFFYPYFYVKDLFGLSVVLFLYFYLVTYEPNLLGHPDNYIEANPLVTPPHMVPEWYFLPFYAILSSMPNKLSGVIFMFLAIMMFFFMGFLEDTFAEEVFINKFNHKNSKFGGFKNWWFLADAYIDPKFSLVHQLKTCLFFVSFLLLGWIGAMPAEEPYVSLGLNLTLFYFFYLFFLSPILAAVEMNIFFELIQKKSQNKKNL